jgi:hypothetical protein
MFGNQAIGSSPELMRIIQIPRRNYSVDSIVSYASQITNILKRPQGTQKLKIIQALALLEIGMVGGLLGPIRVGGGKTLISFLAPVIIELATQVPQRPVLLVPAKLKEKTKADLLDYSRHWYLSKFIKIVNYELLGRRQSADLLNNYRPNLIIADEAHKLINRGASVTKKVARYMANYPSTRFIAMSGTITKTSIKDYAWMLRWSLKSNAPIPNNAGELEEWADALDVAVNEFRRREPGSLIFLANEEEQDMWKDDPLKGARSAYRRRLTETQGVIATDETPLDFPLILTSFDVPTLDQSVNEAFSCLRNDYKTPDGWPIPDLLTMARHARELSLGFYYRWNPRPPDHWLTARAEWSAECRDILSRSKTIDSESELCLALDRDPTQRRQRSKATELLARWRAVENDFKPNTEAVWLSDKIIKLCVKWMKIPGIVWTKHTAFAERLSEYSNCPYYGEEALNQKGEPIRSASGKNSIIASIGSCGEGQNLQMFSRGLIVCPPANGVGLEQLLGRCHREGQEAHEVTAEFLAACLEHCTAIEKAINHSNYMLQTTGQKFKVLTADKNLLKESEYYQRPYFQWRLVEDE